jgi:hypothetical protein
MRPQARGHGERAGPPQARTAPPRGAAQRRQAQAWGHRSLLPHFLATLYGLAIVYASLQPFISWMEPVPNTPYFLFASWPPRWIRYDFIINILAYVPLGSSSA